MVAAVGLCWSTTNSDVVLWLPWYAFLFFRFLYFEKPLFSASTHLIVSLFPDVSLQVQRGYIHLGREESAKLHSASLETTEDTAEWLRGIFLAEDCDKDAYVFCYDGARRRMNQVKGHAAVYKYRTHTMQSGQYLYDASDTDRYPNGLVNTQPHGSALTPYTCSWGKPSQQRQKNAPKATNRNLFLASASPAGSLITVNFGHDYNTEGFVKLVCLPNNRRVDRGTAHGGGRRYGNEVIGLNISVYWPLDQSW